MCLKFVTIRLVGAAFMRSYIRDQIEEGLAARAS
jgi:hypothetical protein